jgi:hypothetical protein
MNRREGGVKPPNSKSGLTPLQSKAFWRALGAACSNMGLHDKDEKEAYRKRVMREETGKEHMAELNRTRDYERIMARLHADAGNYEAAVELASGGNEKRMAWLIEAVMRQVFDLATCELVIEGAETFAKLGNGATDGIDYVIGICRQAGYPVCARNETYWMDLSEGQLKAVFEMLDTHRRRMLRRSAPKLAMRFDASASYLYRDGGVAVIREKTPPPASVFRLRVVAAQTPQA